jgi:hypothetical protein
MSTKKANKRSLSLAASERIFKNFQAQTQQLYAIN